MRKPSKSSKRWLSEHFSDPYVKRAQREGWRSRAVYKLQELQEKYTLFKSGMVVVDLGAAPGGWSQLLTQWIGKKGKVFALDILPMDPIAGVDSIEGDFTEQAVVNNLFDRMAGAKADWVVSDMAPNISGIDSIDQPRSMALAELALDLALNVLQPKGSFLVKIFQGEGVDSFLVEMKRRFQKVIIRKPKASRDRSKEIYLLGIEKRDS